MYYRYHETPIAHRVPEHSVWRDVIDNNEYLNNKKKKKPTSSGSMKEIIDRDLTQSQLIMLGSGIEKVFTDYILKTTSLKNIKNKTNKGSKETDHLFLDEVRKRIYYAEIKSNLNLDTEKARATIEKCKLIVKELENQYTGYSIVWSLVCSRYVEKSKIPNILMKKFGEIEENVVGANEYFKSIGCPVFETEVEYHMVINDVADKL